MRQVPTERLPVPPLVSLPLCVPLRVFCAQERGRILLEKVGLGSGALKSTAASARVSPAALGCKVTDTGGISKKCSQKTPCHLRAAPLLSYVCVRLSLSLSLSLVAAPHCLRCAPTPACVPLVCASGRCVWSMCVSDRAF